MSTTKQKTKRTGVEAAGGRRKKARSSKLPAALEAAFGIWRDRKDLPKDAVEAAKYLRAKASSRVK